MITQCVGVLALAAFIAAQDDFVLPGTCDLTRDACYPECSDINTRLDTFDFIIVGGGTAGSTLANRLTENPAWNVLLLEAGRPPSNLSEIPGLFEALQGTSEDWAFQTEPESTFRGYKNSVSLWAQGRALGGGSTINAMVYAPGVPQDYDDWEMRGAIGWGWSGVQNYFQKLNANVSRLGYLRSTSYVTDNPARAMIIKALNELEVPVNDPSTMFGYRDMPVTIFEGQRFSMAKAYLMPIKDRPNLCVVTGALVKRLQIHKRRRVHAVEVEMPGGEKLSISPRKEVLVSAGAINTPKILLQSGLGPRVHLKKLQIPIAGNLMVGRKLQNHMMIPTFIEVPAHDLPPPGSNERFVDLLAGYCANRTGLSTVGISNFQGYINTYNNSRQQPNIEIVHYSFSANDTLLETFLTKFGFEDYYAQKLLDINTRSGLLIIYIELLHPKSKGFVELRDRDPQSKPRIKANFLTRDEDLEEILAAYDFQDRLLNTATMGKYKMIDLGVPECANSTFASRDYWRCYSRTFPTSIFHPAGTCRMGNDRRKSVVNPRLKVWGMDNLRVVDASVMPELISGHTNVPTCMIAEKASDLIKEDYLGLPA